MRVVVALFALLFAGAAIAQQAQPVIPLVGTPPGAAVTTANPMPVTQGTVAAGSGAAGYPPGATPVQNSATGTTAGTTATLPNAASQFTYLCGYSVSPGSASTAITISITTTGLASNLTTSVGAPVTAVGTTGLNQYAAFSPCLKATAVNTAITVVAGALGTGGVNQAVNAWGYQQ